MTPNPIARLRCATAFVLLLLAVVAAQARAVGADSCAPTDPVCFDALPPDSAWEQAIGVAGIPRRVNGVGVTVASIDTGVVPNADLGARLLARVDFTSEGDGIDRFGHGTHMAGVIAGNGVTSSGAFDGAAPEANIVSVKVAGWDGATDVSTVIAALRWAVSNRERYGIRVVNLSWGTDAPRGYGTDPLDLAVERAWRAGLVVVVAAGNAGPTPGTLTKPGDDPYVITVGAADTAGTATRADDTVASFSSRGPTPDGIAKPDVLAPGVSLVSDRAPGSTIDAFKPTARVGTALFKGSGSSQAAAVVSGIAARMIQANPALTNDQVKGILIATAAGTPTGPGAGAGLIDAADAVALATPLPKAAPPVLPSANAGLAPSTGLGTLEGSRGTHPVYSDRDGDGVAEMLSGEVDALGNRWDASAYAAEDWTAASWPGSPWAAVTAEAPGAAAAPAPALTAPLLAWEAKYWGASSWQQAAWDAKYWGATFWGAKYWGTGLWQ